MSQAVSRQPFAPAPGRIDAELTLGEGGRVWEGLVTTVNADGSTNIAPMGPIAGRAFDRLLLRPFCSSRTHANLQSAGVGVFHLIDDVELLARAAIGVWDQLPGLTPIAGFAVPRLVDCARWYAFRTEWFDEAAPRSTLLARVVDCGIVAEMAGFNRAQAAVVEAAILATRVDLLEPTELRAELKRLAIPVQKTGAAVELRALTLLQGYVDQKLGAAEGNFTR
ncbi:MAG: DUF447 family protein [Planctomycetales bacterium]|nr:DUF447 family protein [Planctomycetales bacterium]